MRPPLHATSLASCALSCVSPSCNIHKPGQIFSMWSGRISCKLLLRLLCDRCFKVKSNSGGGVTHLTETWSLCVLGCRRIIHSEASVGTKSFGNPRQLICVFLNGGTLAFSVHPALPDGLICICLSVSYPSSECLHKTTMGLRQITACVCLCVCLACAVVGELGHSFTACVKSKWF